MDTEYTPRRKKGDKAKEKFARNGGYSQKHVREAERIQEEKKNKPPKKKYTLFLLKI
jgi:hypothetical protein